jgi:hypothetical protein
MLNKSVLGFLLAICLLMSGLPLMAQTGNSKALPDNVPALMKKANSSFVAEDYTGFRDAMMALHKMRPNNSDYMYQLVIANALVNNKTGAYDMMLRMQKQGLAYDFLTPESTKNIRGTQVFDYLSELMILAGEPMGESAKAFELPGTVTMPETIEWDASREKFLIGTISEGSILAVGLDGQVTELLKANNENGLWAVMDILVDQANNKLWVTSAAISGFSGFDKTDKGRSALFEFDLKTLELVKRYPVPVDGQAHILGSMVANPKGDIFIADRYLPLIYSKYAAEEKLKPLLVLKDMISMRGMAMQEDGSIMYVADREMGITMVEMKSGKSVKLPVAETLNLGGIDGIYLKNNALVIIQNGIQPQRVLMLQLDPAGTRVAGIVPMAVAQAGFDYPSYGAIKGEELYYFANSHWAGGPKPYKPITVLRSPLNSDKELVHPDMKRYLQKQAEEQQRKSQNTEAEKN